VNDASKDAVRLLLEKNPLLMQNLRSFHTLSLTAVNEESEDGKQWKTKVTKRIKWDLKKNYLYIKKVEYREKETELYYSEASYLDGRATELSCYIDRNEKDVLNPKKKANLSAGVGAIASDPFNYARLSFMDLYYVSIPVVDEVELLRNPPVNLVAGLGDKSLFVNKVKIITTPNSDEIHIRALGTQQFVLSKKKGTVIKRIAGWENKDGTWDVRETKEVVNFCRKNGWIFPVEIVAKGRGKRLFRERIDVETLEIDKPLSLSDFTVVIPAGTAVYDGIKGIRYFAGKEITTMDLKKVETQLKAFLEKAEKDTK
jgi:hypothetical protein